MALKLKGCGMGTLFVLVSPCFRENVVATCKIGSFLCSLDNILQKKRNCFLLWKSNFKMALIFKKGLFLTHFSHFLVNRESYKKKILQHIHTCILLILLTCFTYQFWKKYGFIRYGFSLVWVLALILICAILEQSINNKMVSKI